MNELPFSFAKAGWLQVCARHLTWCAALEVFIARELYGLSLDDWKHLTGTFTYGSGATREELDEIIGHSLGLWNG